MFLFPFYPFPKFTTQLLSKLTVQLKTLARFEGICILSFCSVDFCCQYFFGKKYSWREKQKTSLLVPVTWYHLGSLTFFSLSTFLVDTLSHQAYTHVCKDSTRRHLFSIFVLVSFQLITHFQSFCLD